METSITKDILQHKLYSGIRPAIELLYGRYGGMLYGFILQFIPDRKEAEELLANIFIKLTTKLQEACQSPLSVYCWMQLEARKMILEHERENQNESLLANIHQIPSSYLNLLRRATEEQRWVFRELFMKGRQKEELALQLSQDCVYIDKLLRESLGIIRARLG